MPGSARKLWDVRKSVQITEVDEVNHVVYGIATEERVDQSNEICSYDDSKPEYINWSTRLFEATSAAGQIPSLGNIRLQHDAGQIAGKITKIDFDDAKKQIRIATEPLNETIWDMVRRGFVTGFSQGGKYMYRVCAKCSTDMESSDNFTCPKCNRRVIVKYAIIPSEVSYVDNPCLTTASFMYIKADGSKEIRKFAPGNLTKIIADQGPSVVKSGKTKRVAGEDLTASAFAWVGDPDEPSTWKLPIKFSSKTKTETHIRNALSRFGQTEGIPDNERAGVKAKLLSAARQHGIHATGPNKFGGDVTVIKSALLELVKRSSTDGEGQPVQKDMYHIGFLSRILQDLKYLESSCRAEGAYEEDERDIEIADDVVNSMADLIAILKRIVDEETSEMLAAVGKAAITQGEKVMLINDALKAARATMAGHFRKAAAHHESAAELHKSMADEYSGAAETHKSAMDSCEDAMKSFHRGMSGHYSQLAKSHNKLNKSHSAQCDHCNKMAESQEKEGEKVDESSMTKVTETPVVVPAKVETPAEKVTPIDGKAPVAAPAATELPVDFAKTVTDSVQGMIKVAMEDAIKSGLAGISSDASIKDIVTKTVSEQVRAVLGGIVAPSAVAKTGAGLVGRDGTAIPTPGDTRISGLSDDTGL